MISGYMERSEKYHPIRFFYYCYGGNGRTKVPLFYKSLGI